MAVIAPFLQRQLYDEAVTEMADELRLKAGLLESSDSDASDINGKAQGRTPWELPKPADGEDEQVLVPRRSSAEMLRRRRRTAGAPSGQDKVSNWLLGSTDWSRQFLRSSTAGNGSGVLRKSRHAAGVVAGVLGGGAASAAGPTRHVVPYEDFSNWWLRFNLRGRLEEAFPVLSPNTRRRTAWDIFVMALVLYGAVTVPLAFSYGLPYNAALTGVEWALTAIYAIDIAVNFRTAHYDDDGNIVRDSWPVARRYLLTWFPIDFLATLPFDVIAVAAGLGGRGGGSNESQLMALAVLKTPRLLRLIKLMRLLDRVRNANLFKVLQLILLMMMIAHWLACIWYVIARYAPGDQDWGFDTLDDENRLTWYLSAFYYSFLLLIGDNIQATNNYERLFFILALVAGACFYSAVVGNMALLVANMNTVAVRFRQKLDMTQDALRYMRVPEAQRERVQAFYDFITQFSHPGTEGFGFLSELTKGINEDLHIFLHSDTLRRVYLFKDCEPAFVRSLAMRMKIVTFIPGEVIFRQGDLGHEMYIIRAGCVAVISKNNEVMSLLQAGDFFGEIALLTQARRTAKCIALSNCDLAILNSFDIKVLMKEFPQSASRLQEAARDRLRQLQIAGRAGTGAGPDGDDDGQGDEDADRRREREEVRRQRRTVIARFTTGRGAQLAKAQPRISGDDGRVAGSVSTGDDATAVGERRGGGGGAAAADGADSSDGGLPAGNHVDESSRNSYTSLATEDSAREFTSRRRTNSMTSQGGLSAPASVPTSRRTSTAGATVAAAAAAAAAAALGLSRSNTAAEGGSARSPGLVSERLSSGAMARSGNLRSSGGGGGAPAAAPPPPAAGGVPSSRRGVSRLRSRSPTAEGAPLTRLPATAAAAALTSPPASTSGASWSNGRPWSALFTRRGGSRSGAGASVSSRGLGSKWSTVEGMAGPTAVATAVTPAAKAGAAGRSSDASASITDGAALDLLTCFDAVERFQPPAPGAGALSPISLSAGGTLSVGPLDGSIRSTERGATDPWVTRPMSPGGPVAEGVEQVIAPYLKHAASVQARLRPGAAGAAGAGAGSPATAVATATAATEIGEAPAAAQGSGGAPSIGNSRRTSITSVGDARPVVAATRGQSLASSRRERRASLVLPYSTTGTADFAAAVAAAVGLILPPGGGGGSGGGGGCPADGGGLGGLRTRLPPPAQPSACFANALAATAASVAYNGAAARGAAAAADTSGHAQTGTPAAASAGSGGGAAASASGGVSTAVGRLGHVALDIPSAASTASVAASTMPMPYSARHLGGAALRAPEGAASSVPHTLDPQGPYCLMRSAAVRRAEALTWQQGEQLESPFYVRSVGEESAGGGGGGGRQPSSPLPHLPSVPSSSAAALHPQPGRPMLRRSVGFEDGASAGGYGGGGETFCLSPLDGGGGGGRCLRALGSGDLSELAPPGYGDGYGDGDAEAGTGCGGAAAASSGPRSSGGGGGGGGSGGGGGGGAERLVRTRQIRTLRRSLGGIGQNTSEASGAVPDELEPARYDTAAASGGGGGGSAAAASDEGGDDGVAPFVEWISASRATTAKVRRHRRQSSCEALAAPLPARMLLPSASSMAGPALGGGGGGSAWAAAQLAELHRAEVEHNRREVELARREADLERREAEVAARQAEAAAALAEAEAQRQEATAAVEVARSVHVMVLGLAAALTELVIKVEQLDERLDDADAAVGRIEAQHGHGRPTGNEFLGLGQAPAPVAARPGIILERNTSIDKRFAALADRDRDRDRDRSVAGKTLNGQPAGGGGGGTRRSSSLLIASGDFFVGKEGVLGGGDVSVSGRWTRTAASASISGMENREGGGGGGKARRSSALRPDTSTAAVSLPPLGRMAASFTASASGAARDSAAPSSPSHAAVGRTTAPFNTAAAAPSTASPPPPPSSALLMVSSALRNSFQKCQSGSWRLNQASVAAAAAAAAAAAPDALPGVPPSPLPQQQPGGGLVAASSEIEEQ